MGALMTDLPIVCTLSAEGLRARKQGLLAEVARRATRMTKIPEGYRLEFDAESDTLSLIATMIDADRQGCRFLRFELSVVPRSRPSDPDTDGSGRDTAVP